MLDFLKEKKRRRGRIKKKKFLFEIENWL